MLGIVKILAVSLLGTLAVSLVLILTNTPRGFDDRQSGLDFSAQLQQRQVQAPQLHIELADGFKLRYRRFASSAAQPPLLILVHGSGWHGAQFEALAQSLSEVSEVVVPDLRGHGASPEQRGDVAYIGQLEDDIAALVQAVSKPDQQVVLSGHSSGGGLVIRFAGGQHRDLIDKAVLLAPFLKHNAPTMRENSGGWARALTRRIIGLSILNTFGITALNHLPVIEFNMPKSVLDGPLGHTATTQYSYRMNTSFAPRSDYLADIALLPPFLLVAGQEDEAFRAEKYEETLKQATDQGQYLLVDGVSHLDIVNAPETVRAMQTFLKSN